MAFAGYGDQGNLSKLIQAPLAFSGRSRTQRQVEVTYLDDRGMSRYGNNSFLLVVFGAS